MTAKKTPGTKTPSKTAETPRKGPDMTDQARQPKGVPTGGEFATAALPENDDLDGVESDCPLCGSPISYCQGHGEWNASEEMKASEVREGDRVWDTATASGHKILAVHPRGKKLGFRTPGGEMLLAPDAAVQVLPKEDDYISPETADQDQSIKICPRGADCTVKSCKKWHPVAPLVETDPVSLQTDNPAPADIDKVQDALDEDGEVNDQASWGPGYGPDPVDANPEVYARRQDSYDNSVYGR